MAKLKLLDPLSPDASPTEVSKRFGVRRVNNMPLYLLGSAMTLFLVIMGSVWMDRVHQAQAQGVEDKNAHAAPSQLASTIMGNRTGGFIPAADAALPDLPPDITVPIAIPDDMDSPPLPPRLKETTEIDPDSTRIYQEKMQLFENAVRSKTAVPFTDAHVASPPHADTMQRLDQAKQRVTAMQTDDVNTAFKTRLAQLQGKEPAETASPKQDTPDSTSTAGDRWTLGNHVEAPQTPYTLRAGFVIPASLISGINSQLPGQIIGQISQNVYDTATGKHLLLPQGSRLVGSYTADVAYGQSRVMVAWQRIVFPDGKTLDIGAMPGADSAGYAGFTDQVNNHYLRIFGSALLMSGITAGATLSQDNNTNSIYGQTSASTALSEALGQQLGTVTTQMINKNLSIAPTLEIRPGFRFNVMVVKDLVLDKPYASFDY